MATRKTTTDTTTAVPEKTANEIWAENPYAHLLKQPTEMSVVERLKVFSHLYKITEQITTDTPISEIAAIVADTIDWLAENATAVPTEEFNTAMVAMKFEDAWPLINDYTAAVGE